MADPNDLRLLVEGFRHGGWKSLRVTQTMEGIAGSFALETTDRWGAEESWSILEEDECQVLIGDDVVIDGFVDKRNPAFDKSARTLSLTGRDRAAALVDNSLILADWTFRNITLLDFAKTIAKKWGVSVSAQAGLTFKKRDKIVVQPGDKAYEALAREATEEGVMLVSDGAGGIVITRGGLERAAPLVEGDNIYSGGAEYDGTDRYYRYVVMAQAADTDECNGDDARVLAEAFDEGVRRKDRELLIQPDKGYNAADAKRRADWEARIRAARSEPVNVTVQGWRQPNGKLWRVNTIAPVRASRGASVNGDMRITQVEYTVSAEGGTFANLRLMRPDAFTPEPTKAKVKSPVKSGSAGWKELEKGAL